MFTPGATVLFIMYPGREIVTPVVCWGDEQIEMVEQTADVRASTVVPENGELWQTINADSVAGMGLTQPR